ncbi:MAG: hemerythrin domain-containing protein [Gammaproteobacteria bacterium]|nr:hemerythrin domain-containing protein [Gammaproteobacteria bacterium]
MSCRIVEVLHEDHVATAAFVDRLAKATAGPERPRSAEDPAIARVLRDAASALGEELGRHFDFEERPLFERLADDGEQEIVAQLLAEHDAIRPLAATLAALGRAAQANGFTEPSWAEYRTVAAQLCAALRAHVEIEEQMLLPLLEGSLDAETDARLQAEYAGNL